MADQALLSPCRMGLAISLVSVVKEKVTFITFMPMLNTVLHIIFEAENDLFLPVLPQSYQNVCLSFFRRLHTTQSFSFSAYPKMIISNEALHC